ncbi:hypothetical protein SCWH03_10570 [Streptomyces pacificus]|uniref:Uncharacterized protein n=1 Tax=Streptomyces pacificus TaxID=2705029 RepID=A0A6A0ARF3_9ACTN|nr:hypothetical protein SCWH03_10570 [Streptomyces pacificus]
MAPKHVSAAAAEGGAARPGGSRRLFPADGEQAEEAPHAQLTAEVFRDAQTRNGSPVAPPADGATRTRLS